MERIDFVVPMVFPEDVFWQNDFKKVGMSYTKGHTRWRSWGTEQMLIQLVRKYMPWIRYIYILLARRSQLQYWMNNLGASVVYHKEFIPSEYLPTFNSCTIEMFLHKIPGLSEHFIYANDDMFPLSEMKPDDFFINGIPCMHMREEDYPATPNTFHRSCMAGQRFAAKMAGVKYNGKWLRNGHNFAPLLKSSCESLLEIGLSEIKASISAYRQPKNFSQYIYSWYAYYKGNYIDKQAEMSYINPCLYSPKELEKAVKGINGIACINDSWSVDDYTKSAEALRKALQSKLI